jgi:hypothetical protein
LLEVVLPPQSANNVIGDLVEEFCVRVHRDGVRDSQRWFWLQALHTSRISIREGWIIQRVVGEAKRWRLVAFSLAVFALSMFYFLSLHPTRIDGQFARTAAIPSNFELTVRSITSSSPNTSQTDKNNRQRIGKKSSVVSLRISPVREKPGDDKLPSDVPTEAVKSIVLKSTDDMNTGTIYPFREPGVDVKAFYSQSASVKPAKEGGCLR